jgi:hypothetical protein
MEQNEDDMKVALKTFICKYAEKTDLSIKAYNCARSVLMSPNNGILLPGGYWYRIGL